MTKDWRSYAYLQKDRWPEAIPWMGPKREYGPTPWSEIHHENPFGIDTYPHYHPYASAVGDPYLGDVCPYCGQPLSWTEKVTLISGETGQFHEIDQVDDPTPAYHVGCWKARQAEIHERENEQLDKWKP